MLQIEKEELKDRLLRRRFILVGSVTTKSGLFFVYKFRNFEVVCPFSNLGGVGFGKARIL